MLAATAATMPTSQMQLAGALAAEDKPLMIPGLSNQVVFQHNPASIFKLSKAIRTDGGGLDCTIHPLKVPHATDGDAKCADCV